jgi:hypothetical protein
VANCQDTAYARKIIDTLASEKYFGRGYIKNGLGLARDFLVNEFRETGLTPLDGRSYLQELTYPVNTFPSCMEVSVNGHPLRPGYDFIVAADSRKLKGTFLLERIDSNHFINRKARLHVSMAGKLTWSVSSHAGDSTGIILLRPVLAEDPVRMQLNVKNKFVSRFPTANICGYVRGTWVPDSFIFFTAHYDHLGGMGAHTYFPGANDNASGVSLLLGLAKWYAANPQKYSIGFVLFTGEEAGLKGSEFFTQHPPVSLQSIRFLINLDLTGTGDEGITVVNASEFPDEFLILRKINKRQDLLKAINSRGKAKNSDHYWFTEKGVPSFFLYTLGGIKAYHDVYDRSATLPNNEYSDLFHLLKDFVNALMNP